MQRVVNEFLVRLSYGVRPGLVNDEGKYGVVEALARAYERARNALEYRADHLVRRAAIERILKRYLVFERDGKLLCRHLMTELSWAKYVSATELSRVDTAEVARILTKYVNVIDERKVPMEWAMGVASAEVEELLNIDVDYWQFTNFTFQVIKQKVKIEADNLDLLIFAAVERIYAQSDDQRASYHILRLLNKDWSSADLHTAYELWSEIRKHKRLPMISTYVRRQMAPLLLLRDMYFANPTGFKSLFLDRDSFEDEAKRVLNIQMGLMSKRVSTAATRSIVYVFLTKMLFGMGVEVPADIWLYGRVAKVPLIINLLAPASLMWISTWRIKLPGFAQRKKLTERTWKIVSEFENLAKEEDYLRDLPGRRTSVWYGLFSGIYFLCFVAVFWLIFFGLGKIGFSLASRGVFVFFVCIVAFFAHRIGQTAKIYSWDEGRHRSSLWDVVWLPILTAGSKFSQGLGKLNFLDFAFDFILEAPFKLILRFLDNWVQFLGSKKEEVAG
mgnify:CR=1 FL=1